MGHSYLIGERLAEDPRTNTIKTGIEKEHMRILLTTPYSKKNNTWKTYISWQGI